MSKIFQEERSLPWQALVLVLAVSGPGCTRLVSFTGDFGQSRDPAGSSVVAGNLTDSGAPEKVIAAALASANPLTVTNAASYSTLVAPNSIISVFGTGLSSSAIGAGAAGFPNHVEMTVQGLAAELTFVSPNQVNAILPAGLSPGLNEISVTRSDGSNVTGTFVIQAVAPGIFYVPSGSYTLAAAESLDGGALNPIYDTTTVANTSTITPLPVQPLYNGETNYLVLYGTGFDAATVANTQVTIRGRPATVAFIGSIGGGLDQINVAIPAAAALDTGTVVPITVSINQIPANVAQVMIAGVPSQSGSYDVVVAGGGSGGMSAALQASRLGHSVAIVEPTDWVGGQMTAGEVSTMDGALADTWGVYADFVAKLQSIYGTVPTGTCYWSSTSRCYEPAQVRAALLSLIPPDARFDIFFRESVTSVQFTDSTKTRIAGVTTSSGRVLEAPVLIDATEFGDVIPLTEEQYRLGIGTYQGHAQVSGTDRCIQDITHTVIIKKYPSGQVPYGLSLVGQPAPSGYEEEATYLRQEIIADFAGEPIGYDGKLPVPFSVQNAYRGLPQLASPSSNYTAAQPSEITKTSLNWANDYPSHLYFDAPDAVILDPSFVEDGTPTQATRHLETCAARLRTFQQIYYIQNELGEPDWSISNDDGYQVSEINGQGPQNLQPGFTCADTPYAIPAAFEQYFPPIVYIRESRRLIGAYTIGSGDIVRSLDTVNGGARAMKTFNDAIAVGDYPNDLHGCNLAQDLDPAYDNLADATIGYTGFFEIPLGALIPQKTEGFLVAEKNISQSRLVNGATREQPVTMNVGQAVGTIAHLGILGGSTLGVKAEDVQRAVLGTQLAISTLAFTDVPTTLPEWPYVQAMSSRGLMMGQGKSVFGVVNPVPVSEGQSVVASVRGSQANLPPGNSLLTRADLAVLLMAEAGTQTASYQAKNPYFSDVPASYWAFPAVQALFESGLMSGWTAVGCNDTPATSTAFCPEETVPRGQLAMMAARLMLGNY